MQTNADRHWFLMSYPGGLKLLFHIIKLKVSIALYTFSGEKIQIVWLRKSDADIWGEGEGVIHVFYKNNLCIELDINPCIFQN